MSEVLDPVKHAANIAVMDQNPRESVPAESPLHHLKLDQRPSTQGATVVAEELKLLGHLVIRGDAEDSAFTTGIELALGVELPGPLKSQENSDISIRWISPDEWLVVCPNDKTFSLESLLRKNIKGHFAVVNVSGGQTIVRLSGTDAVNVLKKSVPYDFHDSKFPVGKVITSLFAKTQAVIRRVAEDDWELVIRRSFADYAWRWIEDASSEYGLKINS